MSQFEFVSRLRRCLAGLPEEEIDRAVEYYEDYFADAGESEEDVIKKLGSPEELAENIRRELSEKQEKINGINEEDQGVFTEHGFETKQDRENYQQIDKFTQLEKKENPFEKKEETKNETKNNGQNTSGSYYSGQYGNQGNSQYHYDDRKERKKNRKFIATLVMIFGFIWVCILILIAAVYLLFSVKGHHGEETAVEYADEIMEDLKDFDPIDQVTEALAEDYVEEDKDNETDSSKADILPDQDIKELKINVEAGNVVIQEGEKFSLKIKKNPNNAKIKSTVNDGIWKIEEDDDWEFHFNLKDLKNIVKGIKKGISILITVPTGFEADKIDIEVDAGKVTAKKLAAKEASFEVDAGNIKIDSLEITNEIDIEIGMGKADILSGNIHNLNLECDMGKASFGGVLTGKNKINCNMGSIELKLDNPASDYSFFAESDMGSITIDGESYSGFSSNKNQGDGETEVRLETDMGAIKIKTGINS